jgi:diguanylate cyclase (GGDEF)-like protein
MDQPKQKRQTSTILIVDDLKTNIDILVGLLDDYDVVVATDGLSAIEIVIEEKIDLILLDIMMPEMDGYQVCEKLKQDDRYKDIPIIFITAKTDEESIEKAYDVGGVDYVTKPFKPKELLARIKVHLEIRSLIDNLEIMASHDTLTGIYNRRKFFELSNELFENESSLYAVMIDIDKFKKINDTHGHGFGDVVIKKLTQTINKLIKPDSIFGRLGGEEFAIICKEKTDSKITQHVETVRHSIETLNFHTDCNEQVKVTISCGIAKQEGNKHIDLDHFLKAADDSLYKAKNSGRNKTIFRT